MERVSRTDYVGRFDSSRRTPQGGLKVTAYATRTGVFVYRNTDGTPRRELRHPEEVFQSDSLASLAGAPVTVGHPGKVGPDNYKTHSVGHVGDDVAPYKDKFVRTQLRVQEDTAVKRVDAGELVELSCGYDCDLEWKPGEYKGEKYDAIQRNIVYNHVALLPVNGGRAGNDVRIRFDGCDDVGIFSDREDDLSLVDCEYVEDGDSLTDMGDEREDCGEDCEFCEHEDCHEGQDPESCHPKDGGSGGEKPAKAPKAPKHEAHEKAHAEHEARAKELRAKITPQTGFSERVVLGEAAHKHEFAARVHKAAAEAHKSGDKKGAAIQAKSAKLASEAAHGDLHTKEDPAPKGKSDVPTARSPKQKANSGKSQAHVIEHHTSEGVKATHYPSKKAAHEAGMEIRRAGGNVFVHPKDSPHRATKDDEVAKLDSLPMSAQIENDLAKSRQDAADLKVKLDSVTGERDALAAKVKDLSDTKRFDAAVTAACQLREDARSILGADAKFEGKTSRDIMIDALKKVDSDFKCDENTTVAYLQGRFDSEVRMTAKGATSLAKTRVIVDTTQTKVTPAKQDGTDENPVEAAQKRNQERSANAWKKDGK